MPPGGRGGEILPGVAPRSASAAALSRTRNSMKGGPAMRGRKPIKAVMAECIYFAMGRTAKSRMAECIYLLEEPILSLIGGTFVNRY